MKSDLTSGNKKSPKEIKLNQSNKATESNKEIIEVPIAHTEKSPTELETKLNQSNSLPSESCQHSLPSQTCHHSLSSHLFHQSLPPQDHHHNQGKLIIYSRKSMLQVRYKKHLNKTKDPKKSYDSLQGASDPKLHLFIPHTSMSLKRKFPCNLERIEPKKLKSF